MAANRTGTKQHTAVLYHCPGMDAFAFAFLLWDWFARQHRFIQPCFALGNLAIYRHAIAGRQAQ
ncbi:Uncharacterised protein [Shigella sonnei]|nr:Uncharacterised protein [Shigella sonnei]